MEERQQKASSSTGTAGCGVVGVGAYGGVFSLGMSSLSRLFEQHAFSLKRRLGTVQEWLIFR